MGHGSGMPTTIGHDLAAMLPRLRRFALTLCRSPALADDLVQGACEKALAHADSWTPETRLDAWVFRILRNHWIDHLRRTRADPTVLVEVPEDVADGDGEGRIMSQIHLAEVRRAIDALPDEQREVILLVCVEDLAYREAADVLGVPIGTVMSRLSRARQRLIAMTQAA
jgi:RNA polymerase sigma-70 factor (ECF subfamily)